MHRVPCLRLAVAFGLFASAVASANVVDEKKEIYLVRPIATVPAWTETGLFLETMFWNIPNAKASPMAQVGWQFTPSFSWSAFDMLELRVAFPVIVNPDGTGQRELRAADRNPNLKQTPIWDDTPDLDLPGFQVGLKGNLIGRKGLDRFFLAVGVVGGIPLYGQDGMIDKWSTNLLAPKTMPGHANSLRLLPYLSFAYDLGRFSPQLQVGASVVFDEEYYDPNKPPMPRLDGTYAPLASQGDVQGFFSLALPFAFLYERTAPMLEVSGVIGKDDFQLFLSPAVTFLPKDSNLLLAFACMIPIGDGEFREQEGFRVLINVSYRLDVLAVGSRSPEEEGAEAATPPAGW